MNYSIQFYTLYLEQIAEIWQSIYGKPLPQTTRSHRLTVWHFGEDEDLAEESLHWLMLVEATGFVHHVKRIERAEGDYDNL